MSLTSIPTLSHDDSVLSFNDGLLVLGVCTCLSILHINSFYVFSCKLEKYCIFMICCGCLYFLELVVHDNTLDKAYTSLKTGIKVFT